MEDIVHHNRAVASSHADSSIILLVDLLSCYSIVDSCMLTYRDIDDAQLITVTD